MFRSLQEALSYYNDELANEIESEYYEANAYNIVDNYNESKKAHWYFWGDNALMQDCIQKAKTRLKEILQDGSAAEDYDAIESAVKEQWQDNANGEQDEYPDWDDYRDSNDYSKEAKFISEMWQEDFNENYEEEMKYFRSYRDWRDLSGQIDKLDDEIDEMGKKIPEIILQVKKRVVSDIFED